MDNSKLTAGTRVSLDMTTLTIMRALPREVHFFLLVPVPETSLINTAVTAKSDHNWTWSNVVVRT